MAQMQPIPSAMAVLVDAVPAPGRSQEEIVSLFGRLDGIEISIRSDNHDLDGTYNFASQAFQQSSTLMNPFGIVTATRGAFPIKSTAEGNPTIATLCVASNDRFVGDMAAAIVLPDNTVLAQWSRSRRPTMITSGDTELPVSVFGAPYGKMTTSTWGMHHTYVDASGSGVKHATYGCCQPKCYWVCASFACFFPTCGIAAIAIMCCVLPKVPVLFVLKVTPAGPSVGTLKLWEMKMRTELKEGIDAKTRTAAALMSLFMIADDFIAPPSQGGGGDGGIGGAGAPHVATMDR